MVNINFGNYVIGNERILMSIINPNASSEPITDIPKDDLTSLKKTVYIDEPCYTSIKKSLVVSSFIRIWGN